MIEKLKRQKIRAENLKYSNQQELDDIIRKTKLYLEQLFPSKVEYPFEVADIKFKPLNTIYSMDDKHEQNCIKAWNEGKNSLINLIDTRIEEYEILIGSQNSKQSKPIIEEKIITVENTEKINQLRRELAETRGKKTLWNRINWTTFLTLGIAILGGTFWFGKYIGENRFDNEKIELNKENEKLIKQNSNLNDSIQNLNNLLKNNQTINIPREK